MPSHSEQRRVPYAPDQVYALVADIATEFKQVKKEIKKLKPDSA